MTEEVGSKKPKSKKSDKSTGSKKKKSTSSRKSSSRSPKRQPSPKPSEHEHEHERGPEPELEPEKEREKGIPQEPMPEPGPGRELGSIEGAGVLRGTGNEMRSQGLPRSPQLNDRYRIAPNNEVPPLETRDPPQDLPDMPGSLEYALPQKAQFVTSCQRHGQPFAFYCEACEEPICAECQCSGPHNTESDRVTGLQDAFQSRLEYISSQIYSTMLRKRDAILAQIAKIDARVRDLRAVGSVVERGIKTEYSGLMEELKTIEGEKLAVLQHELTTLQKDIQQIDCMLAIVEQYSQGDPTTAYPEFLRKFKNVQEHMEYAITKPFKASIEALPQELPRKLMERRKQLQKAEQCDSLLQLYDDIIWSYIQENKRVTGQSERPSLQPSTVGSVLLREQYFHVLRNYQLVCAFCGTGMDEMTVNSSCDKNTGEGPKLLATAEPPPSESYRNGRHYFGRRSCLVYIRSDPKAKTTYEGLCAAGKDNFVRTLRLLQQHDSTNRGAATPEAFVEAFASVYKLDKEAANRLVRVLSPLGQPVYYREFMQQLEMDVRSAPTVGLSARWPGGLRSSKDELALGAGSLREESKVPHSSLTSVRDIRASYTANEPPKSYTAIPTPTNTGFGIATRQDKPYGEILLGSGNVGSVPDPYGRTQQPAGSYAEPRSIYSQARQYGDAGTQGASYPGSRATRYQDMGKLTTGVDNLNLGSNYLLAKQLNEPPLTSSLINPTPSYVPKPLPSTSPYGSLGSSYSYPAARQDVTGPQPTGTFGSLGSSYSPFKQDATGLSASLPGTASQLGATRTAPAQTSVSQGPKRYFMEICKKPHNPTATDQEECHKLLTTFKQRKLSIRDLMQRFEAYDPDHKGCR